MSLQNNCIDYIVQQENINNYLWHSWYYNSKCLQNKCLMLQVLTFYSAIIKLTQILTQIPNWFYI